MASCSSNIINGRTGSDDIVVICCFFFWWRRGRVRRINVYIRSTIQVIFLGETNQYGEKFSSDDSFQSNMIGVVQLYSYEENMEDLIFREHGMV